MTINPGHTLGMNGLGYTSIMQNDYEFKRQSEFPFIKRFRKKFPITKDTIFVFKKNIYTNNSLPYDIMEHELEHLRQQKQVGAKKWINLYLKNDAFRLSQELGAYGAQLKKVRELCMEDFEGVLHESATNLSGGLYGYLVSYNEALKLLK